MFCGAAAEHRHGLGHPQVEDRGSLPLTVCGRHPTLPTGPMLGNSASSVSQHRFPVVHELDGQAPWIPKHGKAVASRRDGHVSFGLGARLDQPCPVCLDPIGRECEMQQQRVEGLVIWDGQVIAALDLDQHIFPRVPARHLHGVRHQQRDVLDLHGRLLRCLAGRAASAGGLLGMWELSAIGC